MKDLSICFPARSVLRVPHTLPCTIPFCRLIIIPWYLLPDVSFISVDDRRRTRVNMAIAWKRWHELRGSANEPRILPVRDVPLFLKGRHLRLTLYQCLILTYRDLIGFWELHRNFCFSCIIWFQWQIYELSAKMWTLTTLVIRIEMI